VSVATHFPLSTCASWTGGQQQGTATAQGSSHGPAQQGLGQQGPNQGLGCGSQLDLQQHQLQMGPSEPIPILGVHWLDADALAVVCQQGFSSLLLVLGLSSSSSSSSATQQQQQQAAAGFSRPASLRVYEQVEWMDQPVDRGWGSAGVGAGGLSAWGADCGGSVVGSGARCYLLGQQGGLFCGRLMPWSERLKTLQVSRVCGIHFLLCVWWWWGGAVHVLGEGTSYGCAHVVFDTISCVAALVVPFYCALSCPHMPSSVCCCYCRTT
jgi:hypothetical protein